MNSNLINIIVVVHITEKENFKESIPSEKINNLTAICVVILFLATVASLLLLPKKQG